LPTRVYVLVVVRINIAGAALSHFSLFHTQLANPNVPLSYRLSLSYFNGPGFEGATVVVDEDCMVDTQSPTKYGLVPHKKLKESTHATLAALINFCHSVKVVRQAAHTPAPVAVLRAAMPPRESKGAADDLRDSLLESLEKAGVDTSDAGVGADDASAFYPPGRSVSMSSSASSKSPVPPEDPGQQGLQLPAQHQVQSLWARAPRTSQLPGTELWQTTCTEEKPTTRG
jgi:hypothetical protein